MNTVFDILKNGNAADSRVGVVEEALKSVPELLWFAAGLVKGTEFQSVARTALPSTGFRTANTGVDASGSTYALKTFKMAILASLVTMDKAVADADFQGKEAALAREVLGITNSAFQTLARAIWYATQAVEGFNGAEALCSNVIDLGGTTANGTMSVYAVGNGFENGCSVIFNESAGIISGNEIEFKEGLITGTNSKQLMGYIGDLTSWAGFACTNGNRIARVKNIDVKTTVSGKYLTDAVLADLVQAYEEKNGVRPDALWMPYAARAELQASRAAAIRTAAGGKGTAYAGTPTDFEGIPIYGTPFLSKTEGKEESSSSSSSSSAAA